VLGYKDALQATFDGFDSHMVHMFIKIKRAYQNETYLYKEYKNLDVILSCRVPSRGINGTRTKTITIYKRPYTGVFKDTSIEVYRYDGFVNCGSFTISEYGFAKQLLLLVKQTLR
jgi:hypothetical protein